MIMGFSSLRSRGVSCFFLQVTNDDNAIWYKTILGSIGGTLLMAEKFTLKRMNENIEKWKWVVSEMVLIWR